MFLGTHVRIPDKAVPRSVQRVDVVSKSGPLILHIRCACSTETHRQPNTFRNSTISIQ
jgi:hypothetical protein